MRTLVDIPELELEALNALSKARSTSRAELVRLAIKAFIESNRPATSRDGFGLWKGKGIDGLEFQRRIRSEWDRDQADKA
jgi:Ribbon-helix-helix protein, copG family